MSLYLFLAQSNFTFKNTYFLNIYVIYISLGKSKLIFEFMQILEKH